MKRYLLISLTDGTTETMDLEPMIQAIMQSPKGPGLAIASYPPNHPQYAFICKDVATGGFWKNPADTKQPLWIAPSQIRHVEVVFDTTMFANGK